MTSYADFSMLRRRHFSNIWAHREYKPYTTLVNTENIVSDGAVKFLIEFKLERDWRVNLRACSIHNNIIFHNLEYNVVFCFVSDILSIVSEERNRKSGFCRETTNKNNQFSKANTWISNIPTWSDKAFKDTVVNRTCPSINEGLLKIMLTLNFHHLWNRKTPFLQSNLYLMFCCHYANYFSFKIK